MSPGWDVAIVGRGIGGLVAAAALAARRLRVLVLHEGGEAEAAPGCVAPQGYAVDPPGAVLDGDLEAGSGEDHPLGILSALGVAPPVEPVDPGIQVAIAGHRVSLYRDPARLERELRREVPGDAGKLLALLDEAALVARQWGALAGSLSAFPPRSLADRLQLWRARAEIHPSLRADGPRPVSAVLAVRGLGPAAGALIEALLRGLSGRRLGGLAWLDALALLARARGPFVAVSGGLAPVGEALASRVQALGVECRGHAVPERILGRSGWARGVALAAAGEVPARAVVLGPTGESGVARLLPRAPWWRQRRHGPAAGPGVWRVTFLCGVDERIVPEALGRQAILVPARWGEGGETPTVWVARSPAGEEGWAPTGRCALLVVGWLGQAPARNADGGPAPGVVAPLVGALEDLIPGITARAEVVHPLGVEGGTAPPAPGPAVEGFGQGGIPRNVFVLSDWGGPGWGVGRAIRAGWRVARRVAEQLGAAGGTQRYPP